MRRLAKHAWARRTKALSAVPSFPVWLICAAACLFYGRHLPSTVQGLDTGELVLCAWGLFVPHPPGYPLYVWLSALVTHGLLWGSIFWRASALSAVLAAFVLGAIYQSTTRRWTAVALLILPLAWHPVFWRYALLPDVFMLHAALATAFLGLTQSAPTRAWHVYRLAILFGLGISHHQTFIFLAPIAGWYAWSFRGPTRWVTALYATALSAMLSLALYATLLTLHVDDLASWGALHTVSDLGAHMLRADYGTFRLSPRDTPPGGLKHSLLCIQDMMRAGPTMFGIIAYALFATRRRWRSYQAQRACIVGISLLAYLFIFLPLTNTTHTGVLERFFLLPLVWTSCLAASCLDLLPPRIPGVRRRNVGLVGACLMSIGIACAQWSAHHVALDLQHETIVEDYATNLLGSMPQDRPSILVVHGDTRLHAVRYAQYVFDLRPDVILLSRTALIAQSTQKLKRIAPALRLPPFAPQVDEARYVLTLFERNYRAFDVVVSETRGMATDNLHLTFSGLGRRLSHGTGVDVDWPRVKQMQRRIDTTHLGDSRLFQEEFDLYAPYAYPYLVAALAATDPALARDYLREALLLVPYCLPAHYELCLREAPEHEDVCQIRMQHLRASMGDYF